MQSGLSLYAGPLPAPETLAKFEEVLPGSADRILTRFEKQSDHRMALEGLVIRHGVVRSYLGLAAAVLIACVGYWAPTTR